MKNTTERFFTVNPGSPLFRQYLERLEFENRVAEVFQTFAAKVGMDTETAFLPHPDQLGISIERLGSYMGKLTGTELAKVNHALAISLGLVPNAYERRTKDDPLEKAG